ncbi:MAG: sugar phosphate nucleotidyltransferase [Candidatus Binataceae bacterium]
MPDLEAWPREEDMTQVGERWYESYRPTAYQRLGAAMNQDRIIPDKTNRAAIILAGGEGTRLAQLTRRVDGVHVPKQFCDLLGEVPLLNQTRRRVSLSVPSDRVSFVLNKEHEPFFSPLLAGVSRQNLIVQPRNRGTAPAILYSLLRLAESAPRASVLLMPSDHHVGDEAALMKHVDLAFAAVEEHPQLTVLVGIAPDEPETAYGWIEPAPATVIGRWKTLPVRRFWEKPSREIARKLMATGCLWNSFMMVGQLPTLLGLFTLAMPDLYVSFSKIRPSLGTLFEEEILGRLYQHLRSSDFSRQVLESTACSFSVLPVSNVGWSDLGEPHRVVKALADLGAQQKEAAA